MDQQSPLTMVKGGRTSRGSTGSARLVRPAWTQSRPPAQPVAAVDVSVLQVDRTVDPNVPINLANHGQSPTINPNQSDGDFVGSNVDHSVPIDLADIAAQVYATQLDFPDCFSIDVNFKESVTNQPTSNLTTTKGIMSSRTTTSISTDTHSNPVSTTNYSLLHSNTICRGPHWKLPKYSLPPPVLLGPLHPTLKENSIETTYTSITCDTSKIIHRGRLNDKVISDANSILPIINDIFIDWWCRSRDITIMNRIHNRPIYRSSAIAFSPEMLPVLASLILNHQSTWSITDLWQMWSDVTHSDSITMSVQGLYEQLGIMGSGTVLTPLICQFPRLETQPDTDILEVTKLLPPLKRYVITSPGGIILHSSSSITIHRGVWS